MSDPDTLSQFVMGIDNPAHMREMLLDIAVDSYRREAGFIPDSLPAGHVTCLNSWKKLKLLNAISTVRSMRMSGRSDEQNIARIHHFVMLGLQELVRVIYPMKNPGKLADYIESLPEKDES